MKTLKIIEWYARLGNNIKTVNKLLKTECMFGD